MMVLCLTRSGCLMYLFNFFLEGKVATRMFVFALLGAIVMALLYGLLIIASPVLIGNPVTQMLIAALIGAVIGAIAGTLKI